MTLVDYSVDMHGSYMWPMVKFIHHVDEHDFAFFINKSYPNREFDHTNASHIFEQAMGKSAFFVAEDGAYYLSNSYGDIHVTIAARTEEVAKAYLEHVEKIAPRYEEKDADRVAVTFWSLSEQGPESLSRSLIVPSWEEIARNYTESVGSDLKEFVNTEWRPSRGGQLLLWHGEPGTGKTTALRALARDWREWCEIHYITDPEQFFGQRANYMMKVLVNEAQESEKWRLLVLEDCGELIAADAKQTSGQGLSRLLNTVDGLIGQGLRFLILITTNEPLKKLNDAVTRPGRCLSQIEFDKLSHPEVVDWLKAHKIDDEEDLSSMTIAELYAKAENFGNRKRSQKVGFGFNS